MPVQRFRVPQFIDIEDKILGPITVRQFVIILAACFISALGYPFFDFTLFLTWAIFWIVLAAVMAFVKINGMPFHFFLLNIIQTVKNPPIRVWNKNLSNAEIKELLKKSAVVKEEEKIPTKAPLGNSSLSELALIADTGGVYKGETVMDDVLASSKAAKFKNEGKKK